MSGSNARPSSAPAKRPASPSNPNSSASAPNRVKFNKSKYYPSSDQSYRFACQRRTYKGRLESAGTLRIEPDTAWLLSIQAPMEDWKHVWTPLTSPELTHWRLQLWCEPKYIHSFNKAHAISQVIIECTIIIF